MNKIPHLEREIMHHLFRKYQPTTNRDSYLKAPVKGKKVSNAQFNKNEFDENEWLDKLYEKLQDDCNKLTAPL